MAARLKNMITSAFKMHGLTLRSEASKYLLEVFNNVPVEDREECLSRLIETIQKLPLKSTMIGRSDCEAAVRECNEEEGEDYNKMFSVIDAFSVPRFSYSRDRKKFILNSNLDIPDPQLHCDAEMKGELFRERYTLLHQRTSRHDLFMPPSVGSNVTEKSKKFQLKPVEFLLGSTAKLGDIIVLGMLSQMKEGKWYLEDPTGAVQLDLTRANFHTGLFTENCFVLAEGWYEDEVFHVNAFGFPPPEPCSKSRAYFGNMNYFGGQSSSSVKLSTKLKQLEKENEDAMMVILSDVWLDQTKVLDKLQVLFSGYAEMPPVCFILCGNFASQPYGHKQAKTLKESLNNLAEMLSEFPDLVQNSKFVFVPGPLDPGPAQILPRPAIPDCLTRDFCEKIPTAIFTSNPARIQYCTQEIVVFREDVVMKMCRNCVQFPSDGDITTHFAKTLICQSHLCPAPQHVSPIYWSYDNSLRLYPLPDVVITADKYDPFQSTQVECSVINPGSFPRSKYSFKVYYPASRQIEDSRIADE